jgi:hypothetical protein
MAEPHNTLYDFILNPGGGVYGGAGSDVSFPPKPSASPAAASTMQAQGGLTTRTVPLYKVDQYGTPILPQAPAALAAPWVADNDTQRAMRAFGPTPKGGTGPDGNRLTAGAPNLDVGPAYPFGYSPYDQRNAAAAAAASLASRPSKQDLVNRGLGSHSLFTSMVMDMFAPPAQAPAGRAPVAGGDPWAGLRSPAERGGKTPPGFSYGGPAPSDAGAGLLSLLAAIAGPATRETYNPTVGGEWGSGVNTGPGSPGWSPGVITHDWNNTSGTTFSGESMSFQPSSVQTSSRWNTGY